MEGRRLQTDVLQLEDASGTVENTDHHHLSPSGPDGGNTKVYRLLAELEAEASILRPSRLGDIHVRQHFDSGRHRLMQRQGDDDHILENAVYAEQNVA